MSSTPSVPPPGVTTGPVWAAPETPEAAQAAGWQAPDISKPALTKEGKVEQIATVQTSVFDKYFASTASYRRTVDPATGQWGPWQVTDSKQKELQSIPNNMDEINNNPDLKAAYDDFMDKWLKSFLQGQAQHFMDTSMKLAKKFGKPEE
jgi:hypothetical protein